MSNEYNRLIAYVLWIVRNDSSKPERVIIQRKQGLWLPLSKKKYKLTLRNLRLYLDELKQYDPSIVEVCIDKISRIGIIQWRTHNEDKV